MLETGEHFALVVERDEKRLERTAWSAVSGEQVIRVAAFGATPDDFQAFAARHVLCATLRLADISEQIAQRDAQRGGERGERFEAWRNVAILHAAQHSEADVRSLRDLAERQPQRITQSPHARADLPRDLCSPGR